MTRRVVLAWRKSFPRVQAIEALRQAILAAEVPGVERIRFTTSHPVEFRDSLPKSPIGKVLRRELRDAPKQ